jgi:hypothetical protein
VYLCLSSGASKQYKDDIVRAMAMPSGARLQFRYRAQWVADRIKTRIAAGDTPPDTAIIGYIDQATKGTPPTLVPCRAATVVDPKAHGSTYSLQLELGLYCHAKDIARFNAEVCAAVGRHLPAWDAAGHITGFYWLEIDMPTSVSASHDLAIWEEIVQQLTARPDFADAMPFYTIPALRCVSDARAIAARDGMFDIRAPSDYAIDLYHFDPRKVADDRLVLDTASPYVEFVNAPVIHRASRYDLNTVRFNAKTPPPVDTIARLWRAGQTAAVMSIYREPDVGDRREWQFDIPFRITGSLQAPVLIGLAIGILVSIAQLVLVYTDDKLAHVHPLAIIAVLLVNIGAGLIASLGLPKPLPS